MSRVYATREDTRERVLVEIKCDWCSSTLRPGPHVTESGWVRGGWTGSSTEYEACPRHRHLLEEAVGT
jgi:hypothetical protein